LVLILVSSSASEMGKCGHWASVRGSCLGLMKEPIRLIDLLRKFVLVSCLWTRAGVLIEKDAKDKLRPFLGRLRGGIFLKYKELISRVTFQGALPIRGSRRPHLSAGCGSS
jgi:hypothetical protein